MTADRAPEDSALESNVPGGALQTAKFYARLLGAWIAMGFKSPKISVDGEIHA